MYRDDTEKTWRNWDLHLCNDTKNSLPVLRKLVVSYFCQLLSRIIYNITHYNYMVTHAVDIIHKFITGH